MTPIALLFLSMLWLGLMLGVFAMLAGVERRPKQSGKRELQGPIVSREALIAASRDISARFQIPAIAAFATAFGAVGYPLSRYSGLAIAWQLLVATACGAIALAGAIILIARWALPSARLDVPDERYLLQGMLAQVTDAIERHRAGRIALQLNGMVHAVEAVSVSGDSIDPGTEVVIERIEGETAFVEPWSVVERRL